MDALIRIHKADLDAFLDIKSTVLDDSEASLTLQSGAVLNQAQIISFLPDVERLAFRRWTEDGDYKVFKSDYMSSSSRLTPAKVATLHALGIEVGGYHCMVEIANPGAYMPGDLRTDGLERWSDFADTLTPLTPKNNGNDYLRSDYSGQRSSGWIKQLSDLGLTLVSVADFNALPDVEA